MTDDGTLNDDNVQARFGFGRRYVARGEYRTPPSNNSLYIEIIAFVSDNILLVRHYGSWLHTR